MPSNFHRPNIFVFFNLMHQVKRKHKSSHTKEGHIQSPYTILFSVLQTHRLYAKDFTFYEILWLEGQVVHIPTCRVGKLNSNKNSLYKHDTLGGSISSSLRKHNLQNTVSHTGFISHSVSFYCHPINHSSLMHVWVSVCLCCVSVCGLFCMRYPPKSEPPLDKEVNSY